MAFCSAEVEFEYVISAEDRVLPTNKSDTLERSSLGIALSIIVSPLFLRVLISL
jgi:hypothetical protein